jgi:hypothetical protein
MRISARPSKMIEPVCTPPFRGGGPLIVGPGSSPLVTTTPIGRTRPPVANLRSTATTWRCRELQDKLVGDQPLTHERAEGIAKTMDRTGCIARFPAHSCTAVWSASASCRWSSVRSLMRMSASMPFSCNGMGKYRNRCRPR